MLKGYFPKAPCYERFVQPMPHTTLALFTFMNIFRRGRKLECYFADSKKMTACNSLRIKRNKVFNGIAGCSKNSTDWFYGLKLFLAINVHREILNCWIIPANIADSHLEMMKKRIIESVNDLLVTPM
jgi:hypothetical protein